MIVKPTEEELEQERSFQREQQHWVAIENDKTRQHQKELESLRLQKDIELKRLEVKVVNLNARVGERYETIRRILLGVVKLPVLPLVLIICAIYAFRKDELPEAIESFLEL